MGWASSTAAVVLGLNTLALADGVPVYGSPAFDPVTRTGYGFPLITKNSAGNGVGVAAARLYDNGVDLGLRAVRWDRLFNSAELPTPGPVTASGGTVSIAYAINASGQTAGFSLVQTNGLNTSTGVRWAPNTVPAAMDNANLGAARANVINASGTMAGFGGSFQPLRWKAGGTAVEKLDFLTYGGQLYTQINDINSAGVVIGQTTRYNVGSRGDRAVYWSADSTAVTELPNLGTDADDKTTSTAVAINDAGTIAGTAQLYTAGVAKGNRPVRWEAGTTSATVLQTLGTDSNGFTNAGVWDMSADGTIVGGAAKFSGNTNLGNRPVRWAAGGTAVTELGLLGTSLAGTTDSIVNAINDSNLAVGHSELFVNNVSQGLRAVYWGDSGAAVDLNTLIDPTSGWTLLDAAAISRDGWVTGLGLFDPDRTGPAAAYRRAFLLQIPEPATAALFSIGTITLLRRRRKA